MGRLAQDERMTIAGNEAKTRELKIKLDALNVFEQVCSTAYNCIAYGWAHLRRT